jgi:subtilisin-like proprotein convertase family protein
LIDPYAQENLQHYISYFKKDLQKKNKLEELFVNDEAIANDIARDPNQVLAGPCIGTQLRTYRLALACTGEYAQAVGGTTVPAALSAMTTAINRVSGVYEKELSVRLVFVADENKVIFTNPATDPFLWDTDGLQLLDESQRVIDSAIGNANYDIGHIFSNGGGGIATVSSVCATGIKARGVTGTAGVSGDGFYIDYVAHEMGHQFGARHSFNNASSCGVAASDQNGEPGSGVTIMAYAGVCSSDNIANNSIAFFHGVSFDKISPNISSGTGSTCPVLTSTGNSLPVVNAGSDYSIPRSTPFILNGTATDANGDALTYSWEQVDVGGPNGASTSPSGNAPLFRSFAPVATGERYFPKLSDVNGNITTIGERLPSYARAMKFRLTARDNRAGGGGVCFDETTINVTADTFNVSYPTATNITWYNNDFQTVTWNRSGTAGAPINCANVMIQLSTNGGTTYPTTLIASTANDGSEEIQVPTNLTSQARIRVMAIGNVFYDISNNNFRILNSPTSTFSFNNPAPVPVCGNSAVTTLKTGSLASFNTAINLSAAGNPAGTTVSFGTNPLTPGSSTTVTLNNTGSLAVGTYTVTVTGIAGAVTKTRDIQFVVTAGLAAPSTLSAPAADATGVVPQPSFNWSVVAGASSYVLELSTAEDFSANLQSISGVTTLPYVLVTPLTDNTTYYWRVRSVNTCPGTASVARRFKTGVTSCWTSTAVPVTISATGTPTITSTITIPADKGYTITDLNVTNLTGTHAYVGELTFTLKGPNNATVTLLDQVCAPHPDFNITLDDAAASAVVCPMNTGAINRPSGLLSAFNGINCAGTWTLTIQDHGDGEGGSLTGWGLNINGTSALGCRTVATPLATVYTFTGTGNWNVASNWSGNTVPPNPLPAGGAIVINHSVGGNCTLNVSQTISPGGSITINTGKNLIVPGTLTIQ